MDPLNPTPINTRITAAQIEAFRHLGIGGPRQTVEILEKFGRLEEKQFMCCLDLELTCWLDPEQLPDRKSEIIEIGIVVLGTAPGLEEMSRISVVVKPELNPVLSSFCTELTGITQEEVDGARPLREVWPEVLGKLPDPKAFVWNTFGADANMLEQELADKGLPERMTDPREVDTKLVYRAFKGRRSGGLEACLESEGLTPALPRHRALPDALSLAALTRKLEIGPLDAAISNSSTYRERMEAARSQRVERLQKRTGLSPETCAELLPLVNWDLRTAEGIYKLFKK